MFPTNNKTVSTIRTNVRAYIGIHYCTNMFCYVVCNINCIHLSIAKSYKRYQTLTLFWYTNNNNNNKQFYILTQIAKQLLFGKHLKAYKTTIIKTFSKRLEFDDK